MKNLILTTALAVILLTACSKEEFVEQFEEQNIDSVYVLNQFNGVATWDTMVLGELQRESNLPYSITAHTNGYYLPSSKDAMTITWSGTQHKDGSRKGRAELRQISPNINFHFILDTECVMAEANEAVYGGTIIQIKSLYGNAPNIELGWRFYFKVIDSELGVNIPYDQIANITMFASPRSPSLCGVYPPNNKIWSSKGYTEIVEPGYVIVSTKE